MVTEEKPVTKLPSKHDKAKDQPICVIPSSVTRTDPLENLKLSIETLSSECSQTTSGSNETLTPSSSSGQREPGVNLRLHKKPKRDILLRYQSEVSQENLTDTPEQLDEMQCNKVIDFVTETYNLGMSFQTGCFVGICPTADAHQIAVKEIEKGQPCKIVLSRCSVIDHMNSVTPNIALQLKSSLQDCWKKILSKSPTLSDSTSSQIIQTQHNFGDSRKRKSSLPGNESLEKSAGFKKLCKAYRCQLCDYATDTTKDLFSHSAQKHTEEENMYMCEHCDYITSRQSKLLAHAKCHPKPTANSTQLASASGNDQGQQINKSVQVCDDGKSHVKNYQASISLPVSKVNSSTIVIAQSKLLAVRELVDKKLGAASSLLKGNTNGLDASGTFACKSCSYSSQRLYTLQMHERLHKNDEKIFPCRHCKFSSTRWGRYVEHQYTHKNIFELSCYYEQCEFTTTDSQVLKSHRLLHKVVPQHICEQCGYTTFRKDLLDKHCLQQHSTDSVMGNKLKRYHTSTVQKEQPFKCVICWYTARDSKTLSKHMQIHGKSKETGRFRCNMCKFSTNFEFGLKRHIAHSKACQRQLKKLNKF